MRFFCLMIDDDELPSLPLPLMSPPNLLPLFFCVWSRYPVASPFFVFLFWLSIFLFFSLLVSQRAKCIYSFLVSYISLFFSACFPLEFSTFYVQFFFSLSYTQTLHPRIRFHTPRPSPHKCIHVPTRRFVHALLQIHTRHTYTICLLSAHPHFLIFFLPLHTKKQFTTLSTLLYNLIKQISLS